MKIVKAIERPMESVVETAMYKDRVMKLSDINANLLSQNFGTQDCYNLT